MEFVYANGATLATDNLHGHIREADLVYTINSNVGLESMMLITLLSCFNGWSPMVRTRPYASSGPVSVLTSRDEIEAFLD
jgi:hypothetical protein